MLACVQLWQNAQALAVGLPDQAWQQLARLSAHIGQTPRKRSGDGQDFWQYRTLSPGDSAARIDWRKSARSDSLVQREREQQSRQRAFLWCDMSPSMHYRGSRSLRSKAEQAYLLGAILWHLADRAGDALTLLGSNTVSRRDMAFRLAEAQSFEPAVLRADDLLFVISDFIDLDLVHTSSTRLIALQVQDPDEMDFPFEGHVQFEGLEGEAPLLARHAASLQADYLAAQATLAAQIRSNAVYAQICSSAEAPLAQVQSLIQSL